MLEMLLSSRVRAKILTALFLSPGVERNAWELTHSLGETYSAVWRELSRLEGMGILVSEPRGNAKAYRANPACPIEPELRTLVMKTEGIGGLLQAKLGQLPQVRRAFIYGSVASGKADRWSDIDLMLIGEVDLDKIAPLIAEAERAANRPINYVIFSEAEWQAKLEKGDPFALNVEGADKIPLIGAEHGV